MINIRISIIVYLLLSLLLLLINRNSFYYSYINNIYIWLTLLIYPISIYLDKYNNKYLNIIFLWLIILFNSNDFIVFFISFEILIILLLIYIIIYGNRYKKYDAFYKLWLYSIIGSIFLLIFYIYIINYLGSSNNLLLELYITYTKDIKLLYIMIILSLLIKLPLYPFHSWLTLAHVEANLIGSIILAALILKISIYGIIKYNIIIFYFIHSYFINILILFPLLSIIYICYIIIYILDIKLIIAYSSIIHTNYMLLGLLSNKLGIYGSILSSIFHSFISSSLFILITILYYRYNSRYILYFKGLLMPLFNIFLFINIISNIAIPLTSNFIGELITLISFSNLNIILILIPSIFLLYNTIYNIILLSKIVFWVPLINKFHDLYYKEFIILFILLLFNISFGLYPPYIL